MPADEVSRLAAALAAEGVDASAWSNGPGDVYPAHEHGYDKVLVVAVGSITFGAPDRGTSFELRAGDRLDLPAGTAHDARVGPAGVTCLEAHVPVGAIRNLRRVSAGEW